MGIDPRLAQLLGDRRFRCLVRLLRGRECSLVDIDPSKLLEGDASEVEKVYRLLPELDRVRKGGYDIVGRLVELGRRLKSESVRDLTAAVALMFSVMFGQQLGEEDARRIGEVVEAFKCIKIDEEGIEIDSECLSSMNVPEELKDQIRMISVANLVWS